MSKDNVIDNSTIQRKSPLTSRLIIPKCNRTFLELVHFYVETLFGLLLFVQQLNNGEIDNCFSAVYKQIELLLFLFNWRNTGKSSYASYIIINNVFCLHCLRHVSFIVIAPLFLLDIMLFVPLHFMAIVI